MSADEPLPVGVIGVGAMGAHHARVYRQMPETSLVGVVDRDSARAAEIAEQQDSVAMDIEEMIESADAVSIAVPTTQHAALVTRCMDAGVDVLVEKPFVDDLEEGRALAERASREDVVVQVGHIERFNPAVETVLELANDLDIVATSARRLGPPISRAINDGVILDLMIHDIDVIMALTGEAPNKIAAMGCRDGQHAHAQFAFSDGSISDLTASRLTQRRIRKLDITAVDCQVSVDYLDQSVHIHRRSHPEYTRDDGDLSYRNESVVERPIVESKEPLKRQLAAFIDTCRSRGEPPVSANEAVRVLEVIEEIERRAGHRPPVRVFNP